MIFTAMIHLIYEQFINHIYESWNQNLDLMEKKQILHSSVDLRLYDISW